MIVYLARAIQAFVMYCVNGTSRSSLLIESTDSMIESTDSMIGLYNLLSEGNHETKFTMEQFLIAFETKRKELPKLGPTKSSWWLDQRISTD